MSEMSELPPLPDAVRIDPKPYGHRSLASLGYTADQMRAYAQAAVLAEREACAALCESTYPEWNPENATFQKPCFDTPAECAAAIRARGSLPAHPYG